MGQTSTRSAVGLVDGQPDGGEFTFVPRTINHDYEGWNESFADEGVVLGPTGCYKNFCDCCRDVEVEAAIRVRMDVAKLASQEIRYQWFVRRGIKVKRYRTWDRDPAGTCAHAGK